MLAEQPKHLRDPLKFSKPFEIKASGFDRQKKDPRGRKDPSSLMVTEKQTCRNKKSPRESAPTTKTRLSSTRRRAPGSVG